VENFAAEWLQLRDLRNAVPDPDLFPQFDENLRDAFRKETELFIADQIRDDHGIADLLSANYTSSTSVWRSTMESETSYGTGSAASNER